MRYSLRSLMILVLVGPPLLSGIFWLGRLVNEMILIDHELLTAPWRDNDLPHYGGGATSAEAPDLPNSETFVPNQTRESR